MNGRIAWKVLVVLALILGLAVVPSLVGTFNDREQASANRIIALRPLSFLSEAWAIKPDSRSGFSFVEDEAGICAYTQTQDPINLTLIEPAFRTIEHQNAEYIIGSVEVPDYPESHDVHVYVHADGWVVGYYLAADPTGKIMDLRHYDGVEIASTNLENAMLEVLALIGVLTIDASYYDFRYPDATHLILIQEARGGVGNNFFEVQLPAEPDWTFWERAWANTVDGYGYGCTSHMLLDGNEINAVGSSTWGFAHGYLTPAELTPGAFHTLEVTINGQCNGGFIGITITYTEGS
jgi:hypothetical protein